MNERRNGKVACWVLGGWDIGVKWRFLGSREAGSIVLSAEGMGTMGWKGMRNHEVGAGTERRRPFGDEEGMTSKPQLKQFRFGRRQKWPQPTGRL